MVPEPTHTYRHRCRPVMVPETTQTNRALTNHLSRREAVRESTKRSGASAVGLGLTGSTPIEPGPHFIQPVNRPNTDSQQCDCQTDES